MLDLRLFDVCFKSEDTLKEVYDLFETPLEGSRHVFVHKDFPSLDFNNIVLPNPLDHSHVSPVCSQPFISPSILQMRLLIIL